MSSAEFELRQTEPEARDHVFKFVGGTTAVTKVFGRGMTVTYISSGIVDIAWPDTSENPGTFIGVKGYCFQAVTPGNVKACVVVNEAYVASTRKIRINIYKSGTLTDLAALEFLTITMSFKETNIS